jgi:hypothetical protein
LKFTTFTLPTHSLQRVLTTSTQRLGCGQQRPHAPEEYRTKDKASADRVRAPVTPRGELGSASGNSRLIRITHSKPLLSHCLLTVSPCATVVLARCRPAGVRRRGLSPKAIFVASLQMAELPGSLVPKQRNTQRSVPKCSKQL